MAIECSCPCGKTFRVKDSGAGRKVRCPACKVPIPVPVPIEAALVEEDNALDEDINAQESTGTVTCELCDEQVPESEWQLHSQQHTTLTPSQQTHVHDPHSRRRQTSTIDPAQEPRWYRHSVCGSHTQMPQEVIATYLENPWAYLATRSYCSGCDRQVKQRDCFWIETGENMLVYNERLQALRPDLRPPQWQLAIAAFFNLF